MLTSQRAQVDSNRAGSEVKGAVVVVVAVAVSVVVAAVKVASNQ